MLMNRKHESPYFRVLKNKYEDFFLLDFELLILKIYVQIPRILFMVLSFEFIS